MSGHVHGWSRLRNGVALGIVLVCGAARADDAPRIGTKVTEMYPDFVLPKLDGTMGRLSDYRGKKVLLFHFASW